MHVKNSNIYKAYPDNLIFVYQFLSLNWAKKSKTNVNYGKKNPQITIIQ